MTKEKYMKYFDANRVGVFDTLKIPDCTGDPDNCVKAVEATRRALTELEQFIRKESALRCTKVAPMSADIVTERLVAAYSSGFMESDKVVECLRAYATLYQPEVAAYQRFGTLLAELAATVSYAKLLYTVHECTVEGIRGIDQTILDTWRSEGSKMSQAWGQSVRDNPSDFAKAEYEYQLQNIAGYVEAMRAEGMEPPNGGAHVPYSGAMSISKRSGVPFSKVVADFKSYGLTVETEEEFKKRMVADGRRAPEECEASEEKKVDDAELSADKLQQVTASLEALGDSASPEESAEAKPVNMETPKDPEGGDADAEA